MPLEHPPPPPPPGGGNKAQGSILQWVKDIVTGPYTDEQKEKAFEQAMK